MELWYLFCISITLLSLKYQQNFLIKLNMLTKVQDLHFYIIDSKQGYTLRLLKYLKYKPSKRI